MDAAIMDGFFTETTHRIVHNIACKPVTIGYIQGCEFQIFNLQKSLPAFKSAKETGFSSSEFPWADHLNSFVYDNVDRDRQCYDLALDFEFPELLPLARKADFQNSSIKLGTLSLYHLGDLIFTYAYEALKYITEDNYLPTRIYHLGYSIDKLILNSDRQQAGIFGQATYHMHLVYESDAEPGIENMYGDIPTYGKYSCSFGVGGPIQFWQETRFSVIMPGNMREKYILSHASQM